MKTVQLVLLTGLVACVVACGGYGSKNTTMLPGVTPAITKLDPDHTASLGPAFLLTVNGSNFNTDAVVNWNGVAQTTAFVSGSQVTVNVPASAITAAGTVPVTITNPGKPGTGQYGSGGTLPETSASSTFTIN